MAERLRLGVGTGWNYVEYDALGIDYATRGKRFSEQITLLRKLWGEELVGIGLLGAIRRIRVKS